MASGIEITVLVEFQAKDDDEADEREERLEQFFAERSSATCPAGWTT